MTHEQERACNSVLRVFTPTDITTFYYASLVTWLSGSLKKSSLNHTWFETKLRAINPAKMHVGDGEGIYIQKMNLDCLESFKIQEDKVQGTVFAQSRAVWQWSNAQRDSCSIPASSSSTTKARICWLVWKHYQAAWKQQKSHTANQTFPIAGERQLSERPCVAEVSFYHIKVCEQSPSWLKAPLLQFPAA